MTLTALEQSWLKDFLEFLYREKPTILIPLSRSMSRGQQQPTTIDAASELLLKKIDSLHFLLASKHASAQVLRDYLIYKDVSIVNLLTKNDYLNVITSMWSLPEATKSNLCIDSIAFDSSRSLQHQPSFAAGRSPMLAGNNCTSSSINGVGQNMSMESMMPPPSTINQQPTNQLAVLPSNSYGMFAQMARSKEMLHKVNSMIHDQYSVNFATQFYQLLNTPCPPAKHSLNNTHFFDECSLNLMVLGADKEEEYLASSGNETLQTLHDFLDKYNIKFVANVTEESVRSVVDSHGMTLVSVSGILQLVSGPVGVFDQCFILMKDVFSGGGYKIVETMMKLRSSNAVDSFSQLVKINRPKAIDGGGQQQQQLLQQQQQQSYYAIENGAGSSYPGAPNINASLAITDGMYMH